MNSNENYKVFVGNVPYTCDKQEFVDCFKDFEGFIECDVINKINSDTTRGFGFVIVNTQVNMDNLLQQSIILKNRKLRLDRYSTINNINTYKIFLRNIPIHITEEEIIGHFENNYGSVCSCNVNKNINGGYTTAILEFNDQHCLEKALQDKETEINLNMINIYPFRRKNKNLNIKMELKTDTNSIYRDGFNAGKLIGYKDGYENGMKHAQKNI